MNRETSRRALMASAAALAVSATGVSAEATPQVSTNGVAVKLLQRYVSEVLNKGGIEVMREIFDTTDEDFEDDYWSHQEWFAGAKQRTERFGFDIQVIFGNDTDALAYAVYSETIDGETLSYHASFSIEAENGAIRWWWMSIADDPYNS